MYTCLFDSLCNDFSPVNYFVSVTVEIIDWHVSGFWQLQFFSPSRFVDLLIVALLRLDTIDVILIMQL